MRIRTALLATAIAALPALAMAQTAAPAGSPPAATAPSVAPAKPHREHGDWHKRRAEEHAKYEKLSAGDKAKFDDLTKQMKELHHQRQQILGMSKS
jgi:invasion protein IalB